MVIHELNIYYHLILPFIIPQREVPIEISLLIPFQHLLYVSDNTIK